jgi:acyl transferase domain-containing protein/NAD(P)-dependent dehydrogenase (short-subunit alcohol dehydrogenase family)/acyl carrier protein
MKKLNIAIVGYGCCLPEAPESDTYWKNILQGKVSIRELSEDRWKSSLYVKENSSHPDRIYSHKAAFVEESVLHDLRAKHGLGVREATRLSLMTLAAAEQALNKLPKTLFSSKWFSSFGCMGQDETVWMPRLKEILKPSLLKLNEEDRRKVYACFSEWEKTFPHSDLSLLPSSVFNLLTDKLKLPGEKILVDAACASSLAAIDVAIQKLELGVTDFALAGGIEGQLGPESFATFCAADLLSREGSLPLDQKTNGLSQGEGAVLFALCRAETATKLGLPVHGWIRGCVGTSNGRAASLFSPTVEGQALALEKAYSGLDAKNLVFMEFHATGTRVGDNTELNAVESFLERHEVEVHAGSVKALIGHTKGAAGAAGLLKAVLALKNETVPPSPYFRSIIDQVPRPHIHVPVATLPLPKKSGPRLMGISSAGFGGTNYHLVLEEVTGEIPILEKLDSKEPIKEIAFNEIPFEGAREYLGAFGFRIPPRVLPSVDEAQLAGLMITEDSLEPLLEKISQIPKDRIAIFCAGATGLSLTVSLSSRLRMNEFLSLNVSEEAKQILRAVKESFTPITEDTGAGMLNNVIAGRIANQLDIHGTNFSIDQGPNCTKAAVLLAREALTLKKCDLALVVGLEETVNTASALVERKSISCRILATDTVAKSLGTFSKEKAWVFAGQGSNYPGMFQELSHKVEFRRYFAKADALSLELGLPPVSWYVRYPERLKEEALAQIQNAALFTAQCALGEYLIRREGPPKLLTAHSFGEYAAWVIAGAIRFEEMFEVVAYREKVSPPRNQRGYLIAVVAAPEKISQVLSGIPFFFSNYNSPEQTVISTTPAERIAILAKLQDSGIKHKLLSTPQPYHSPLLKDVAEKMKRFLTQRKLKPGSVTIPVLSSVDRKLYVPGEVLGKEWRDTLAEQLTNQVHFTEQLQLCAKEGVNRIVEIGPRPVLSPLIPKSAENLKAEFALHLVHKRKSEIQETSASSSPWFQKVSAAISKITGYKLEEIRLEDKFQDDLGIDSLMKTEILVTVLKEAQGHAPEAIDFSRFREVRDLVNFLEKGIEAEDRRVKRAFQFSRHTRVWREAHALSPRTRAQSEIPSVWNLSEWKSKDKLPSHHEICEKIQNTETKRHIVILPSPPSTLSLVSSEADSIHSLASLLQTVGFVWNSFSESNVSLIQLVTLGHAGIFEEGLIGLIHSLMKENTAGKTPPQIQLLLLEDHSRIAEALHIADREAVTPNDSVVRYSSGQRFLMALNQLSHEPNPEPRNGASSPVVLAIGGAKGTALSLLESWKDPQGMRLYLAGRSAEAEVTSALEKLRQRGIFVSYRSVDATDYEGMSKWMTEIKGTEGKIDILLNAAGIERSRPLLYKEISEIELELKNKLLPALYLTKLAEAHSIRQVFHFSSIVSFTGNDGQTVYSFANAALGFLSQEATARGKSSVTAIHWPPWDGVGMTEKPMIRMSLAQKGIALLSREKAWELFSKDLYAKHSVPNVYYYDPFDFWRFELPLKNPKIYAEWLGTPVMESALPVFKRTLRMEEGSFLSDHQIGGKGVIPGAYGISVFLLTGFLRHGRLPTLKKVRFQSPIVIEKDGTTVFLQIGPMENGFTAELKTTLPAFSAQIHEPSEIEKSFSLVAPAMDSNECSIDLTSLYAPKGNLFHGPTFQCFKDMKMKGKDQAEGRIDLSSLRPIHSTDVWDRIVQIIDSAFQMIAVRANQEKQELMLPVEVEEVTASAGLFSMSGQLTVHLTSFASTNSGAAANISVNNSSGVSVLILKNVQLHTLAQTLGKAA